MISNDLETNLLSECKSKQCGLKESHSVSCLKTFFETQVIRNRWNIMEKLISFTIMCFSWMNVLVWLGLAILELEWCFIFSHMKPIFLLRQDMNGFDVRRKVSVRSVIVSDSGKAGSFNGFLVFKNVVSKKRTNPNSFLRFLWRLFVFFIYWAVAKRRFTLWLQRRRALADIDALYCRKTSRLMTASPAWIMKWQNWGRWGDTDMIGYMYRTRQVMN